VTRALLFSLACLLVACRSAPQVDAGDRLSVDRLYPLRTGAVWSYDVDTGQGPTILAITRVVRAEGSAVEISVGKASIQYERRAEGLFRPDRQAFVILAPVKAGASWDAGGGSTAEVRSVDRSLDTPAGRFQGCVEIVESGGSGGKVVRTVFCPDVGPVEVVSSMALPGEGQVEVTARLRGFNLDAKPPAPPAP
jgi:hypothetical protein